MLSELRSYRKKLQAKERAKDLMAESRRKKKPPRLVKANFQRHGYKWHHYECSECQRELHQTARFCLECGAWFANRKGV